MYAIAPLQAEDSHDEGNSVRSLKYATRAKRCIMWSVAIKVIAMSLYLLIMIVYIMAFLAAMKSHNEVENYNTASQ